MIACPAVPLEYLVLKREHFNGWYTLFPYMVSVLLVEIPLQVSSRNAMAPRRGSQFWETPPLPRLVGSLNYYFVFISRRRYCVVSPTSYRRTLSPANRWKWCDSVTLPFSWWPLPWRLRAQDSCAAQLCHLRFVSPTAGLVLRYKFLLTLRSKTERFRPMPIPVEIVRTSKFKTNKIFFNSFLFCVKLVTVYNYIIV